jgi:preprotein translocase subunit SecF
MKLFPLHILPNDTKIDFMRRASRHGVTVVLFLASVAIIGFRASTTRWTSPAAP